MASRLLRHSNLSNSSPSRPWMCKLCKVTSLSSSWTLNDQEPLLRKRNKILCSKWVSKQESSTTLPTQEVLTMFHLSKSTDLTILTWETTSVSLTTSIWEWVSVPVHGKTDRPIKAIGLKTKDMETVFLSPQKATNIKVLSLTMWSTAKGNLVTRMEKSSKVAGRMIDSMVLLTLPKVAKLKASSLSTTWELTMLREVTLSGIQSTRLLQF